MATVKLFRGDTWTRSWVLSSAGIPIDLTGASARLHLRDPCKTLIYSADSAGDLVIEPLLGRVSLAVEAEITALWELGQYKFDLEITYATGAVATYSASVLMVMEDQTYDD